MVVETLGISALVTGGTGFIGRRLAERLVEYGCSVRLLVRNPDRLSAALREQCDVFQGDLADLDSLCRAVSGINVVFHCAANVSTWDTWEAYCAVNVDGVNNLLQAISRSNPSLLRLVHVSTVDVYGFPLAPCAENCVTSGQGFGYGESKLLGESSVRAFCGANNIAYTIIRPTNVIGPGSQFIRRIGDALRAGIMLKVDGGQANAGLLYVDNLVDYLIWAASSEKSLGQCYNVRDSYDVTWAEFIDVFGNALHAKSVVINVPFGLAIFLAKVVEAVYLRLAPSREPFLHRMLVNTFGRTCGHGAAKIMAHSGKVGTVDFALAIERSVNWYLE